MSRNLKHLAASAALALAALVACTDDDPVFPAGLQLAVGTWGGENAGMIVGDDETHVHIGCTFGNIPGEVAVDENGEFDVAGSYVLRAFPVVVGPSLPATFHGRLSGNSLRLTVIVNDTVENRVEVRGPVTLRFGDEPRLGPCPICRLKG